MISVENITKTFGAVNAIEDVAFNVNSGNIMGFLGPNGAGKTTTIKVICGLIKPNKGLVRILGHDVLNSFAKISKKTSVIMDSNGLYDYLTGKENLEFYARISGIKSLERSKLIERPLSLVDLHDRGGDLVKTYSKEWLEN